MGKISGGQQAQLALTLALARRPRLLVLDEPMAKLDPLARHDFMATVMTAVADDGVSVVLSSHVLAELERVADYLVLLSRGSVQVAGEVDDLLATPSSAHRPSVGPERHAAQCTSCMPAVPRRKRTCSSAATPPPIRSRRDGKRIRLPSRSWSLPTCASPAPGRCPARLAAGKPNCRW